MNNADNTQRRMSSVALQFITHYTDRYSYLDAARMAIEGGCRWIQLRMKGATDEETESVHCLNSKCAGKQVLLSSSTTV